MHRQRCTDVLAENTDIRRQAAAGYFLAGENLDQLFFPAGGVFGGDDHHLHRPLAHRFAHGGDGLRLVVLDADQYLIRLEDMHQHFDTRDDLRRPVAHGHVISGDIGLALGAVDDQRVDMMIRTRCQFYRGGKACAAQTADAGCADVVEQVEGLLITVVRQRSEFGPLILPVAFQDDRQFVQARGVRVGRGLDGADDAGSRRMQRATERAVGLGNQLALEHSLADLHHGDGPVADVLQQG